MSNSYNISVAPEIAAISALITTVDTVVDSIKLKTDATPQSVRGNLISTYYDTSNAAFQNAINITGHGIVNYLLFACQHAADTLEYKITIDGVTSDTLSHTGDTVWQKVYIVDGGFASATTLIANLPITTLTPNLIPIEFGTSLLVQIRRSAGANANVRAKTCYSLDPF